MFLSNFEQGVFITYEYDGHLRTKISKIVDTYPHIQIQINTNIVEIWYQSKLLIEIDRANNKLIFQGGSTHTEKRIINKILSALELQYTLRSVMETFYLVNLETE